MGPPAKIRIVVSSLSLYVPFPVGHYETARTPSEHTAPPSPRNGRPSRHRPHQNLFFIGRQIQVRCACTGFPLGVLPSVPRRLLPIMDVPVVRLPRRKVGLERNCYSLNHPSALLESSPISFCIPSETERSAVRCVVRQRFRRLTELVTMPYQSRLGLPNLLNNPSIHLESL